MREPKIAIINKMERLEGEPLTMGGFAIGAIYNAPEAAPAGLLNPTPDALGSVASKRQGSKRDNHSRINDLAGCDRATDRVSFR